eukprot:TRINITY_DN5193_c1_g1_i1.p1 TRINITY_DN5193_c1_g1~~TRINITY_DN5193_c1_g1_i1.p1  ORF type:complete len:574 (+),score=135.82 TRINITY_DN5193_c1_g1_i1:71-1723(+)
MNTLQCLFIILLVLQPCASEVWKAGSYVGMVTKGMSTYYDPPLRVLPYFTIGIKGEACEKEYKDCPAYAKANMRIVRNQNPASGFKPGDYQMALIYHTSQVEKELVDIVEKNGGGSSDQTICKFLSPSVANDSRFQAAIKDRSVMIEAKRATLTAMTFDEGFPLVHSDLWIATFVMCDNTYSPVPMGIFYKGEGSVQFISPTGHLSSLHYSYLQFHLFNMVFLIILLACWAGLCALRSEYSTLVHFALGIMVAICVLEQFAMWLFLHSVNEDGGDALSERYLAVTMAALRKIMWCFSLLLLVHGYRTLHASLRESGILYIAGITAIYILVCATSFTYDPRDTLNQKGVEGIQSVVTLFIYLYVVNKLSVTIDKLKAEKQKTKQSLYLNLFILVAGYIVVSFIFLIVVVIAFSTTSRDTVERTWEGWWILYGSDAILFECLLVCLMVLWRPSELSARLLYSIELGAEDDDGAAGEEDIFAGLDEQEENTVNGNPLAAANAPHPAVEENLFDQQDDQKDISVEINDEEAPEQQQQQVPRPKPELIIRKDKSD